jgi:hypothetical protein
MYKNDIKKDGHEKGRVNNSSDHYWNACSVFIFYLCIYTSYSKTIKKEIRKKGQGKADLREQRRGSGGRGG